MIKKSIFFQWSVPRDGFLWLATKGGKTLDAYLPGRFLTEPFPVGGGTYEARFYEPMKESALYLNFARLEPTEDAVLAFANKFGALGDPTSHFIDLVPDSGSEGSPAGKGELLDAWKDAITEMGEITRLWNAARNQDLATLGKQILWKEGQVLYVREPGLGRGPKGGGELIAQDNYRPERFLRFDQGDLVLPAMYVVQKHINANLDGLLVKRLLWKENENKLAIYDVPKSLYTAMWLQFMRALAADTNYRQCDYCGDWFELNPGIGRKNKRFCSDYHRTASHRKRKTEALKLSAQGMSANDIAAKVDMDLDTVTKWLARR